MSDLDNRRLLLAAHAAARAMGRRIASLRLKRLAGTCAGRAPWKRLPLRWARRAAALVRGAAVGVLALPAGPASMFHLHFHLGSHAGSVRPRPEGPRAGVKAPLQACAPAAGVYSRAITVGLRRLPGPAGLTVVRRAQAQAGKTSTMGQAGRILYGSHRIECAAAHGRLPGQPPLTRIYRTPGAHPLEQRRVAGRDAAAHTRLASPLMAPRSPIGAAAGSSLTRQSAPLALPAAATKLVQQIRARTMPSLRWNRREPAAVRAVDAMRVPDGGTARPGSTHASTSTSTHSARQATAVRTLSSIAMARSVDMVWLSTHASAAAQDASPRFGNGGMPGAAPARASQARSYSASSPAGTSNAVVCASALDPLLANRLAEEVMRRIDHRARIERERRGI